jgi:hypothetical protein
MSSRKGWLFGGCLTSLAVFGGCLCWSVTRPDPLQECCDSIKVGMTFDKARAVATEHGLSEDSVIGTPHQGHYIFLFRPNNSTRYICVNVNESMVVTAVAIATPDPTLFQRMLYWLNLTQ